MDTYLNVFNVIIIIVTNDLSIPTSMHAFLPDWPPYDDETSSPIYSKHHRPLVTYEESKTVVEKVSPLLYLNY